MTLAMKMMEERKEGIKEGIEIGVEKGVIKTAVSMLKLKLPLDVIHEATELPLETIQKLATENNISV